jgi:polyphosphate kinase
MDPSQYLNRELSWLEFNQRVLDEALDPTVPLLERVKFLAIVSSNLDEFFMVRVAGLKRQVKAGDTSAGPDGSSPAKTLAAVAQRAHALSAEQHRAWVNELRPALEREGVRIVRPAEASAEQLAFLEAYVARTLLPVLTPIAIDSGHPFPYLANRLLCLAATIRGAAPSLLPAAQLAVVHLPSQVIPRFVRLPSAAEQYDFMLLEDVVRLHLPWLYHGYDVASCHAIRVTRDAEIEPDLSGPSDLLAQVEAGLRGRRMGAALRLQYEPGLPAEVLSTLVDELGLGQDDLYPGEGFAAFADLFQLYAAVDAPRLKEPPLPPQPVPEFASAPDVWSAIRARDVLVHHPYQSFDAVTGFVQKASVDPKVLAIKMTLYRVSPTSPIVQALTTAAEQGKEVAVLLELKARFDEEANIRWARALEAVGAHVVYGLPNYKTHCKACLVVRREPDAIRRYCHLATGNYNVRTGGLYSDLSLFTCREPFGEDLTELFNLLTGYMRPRALNHLLLAPTELRSALVERVRRECDHARAGRPARMILKMNSLVDPALIDELYAASRAGVEIDLIVRGICCLRPEVPGLSERIRVISIIDRYLEHARVFLFENGGEPQILLASADWMPRNLDHRIEIAFPVLDATLQGRVREILATQLADTTKARRLGADGRSRRSGTGNGNGDSVRAQDRLYELLARARLEPGFAEQPSLGH